MDRPDDEVRRARRAWIRDHHPDRGGDPQTFIAGLARFDAEHDPGALSASGPSAAAGPAPAGQRPTVYRSRGPFRQARRIVRTVRRVVTSQPRSRRLL